MKSLISSCGIVVSCIAAGIWFSSNFETRAGDVQAYGVFKGQNYTQFLPGSAQPDAASPFLFRALLTETGPSTVIDASVLPPGNMGAQILLPSDDAVTLTFEDQASLVADLDERYPSGDYLVSVTGVTDGLKTATLTLTGDSYPNAPTLNNFSQLQSVNPTLDFALSWAAFNGGTADDFVQVKVIDLITSSTIFKTPDVGSTGALNGTATAAIIPANTLTASQIYFLHVIFFKISDRDATSYAGAVGLAGYFTETQSFLTASTGGGPGPGGDTNPPSLISVFPSTNATRVLSNSQIVFTFNEPMAPTNQIQWTGNVIATNFNCTWGAGGLSLTCVYNPSLPTNAVIGWTLNGFTDLAGNPLTPTSGQFTTSCEQIPAASSAFSLNKFIDYTQSGANAPVINTNSGATLSASLFITNTTPVTTANLQLPNGSISNLTTFFGDSFFLFGSYTNATDLAAAFPPGNYTFMFARQDGSTSTAVLNFSAALEPNVPQVLNFPALQAVPPEADLTLTWLPFTGATASDTISLVITDEETSQEVFVAPDPCVPIVLLPTDTSIVVPRGIFQPGRKYSASLGFFRFGARDTNSIADIAGSFGFSKNTEFELMTTGGVSQTNKVQFSSITALQNGVLTINLVGSPDIQYVTEASSDLNTWAPISTNSSSSGSFDVTDTLATNIVQRFYRSRTQP